jgi:DNA polymerase-1
MSLPSYPQTDTPLKMSSTEPIHLIIDGDNHLYRAYFKHARMRNGDDSVSALFGMPRIVASMIKKLKPAEVYIVWDGFRDKDRVKIHPEYKKSKARLGFDKDDLIRQKNLLMGIFGYLGIPQLHSPEIEGDDHSYMLARKLRASGKRVVIASSDKDFRQVISENLSLWDDRNNQMVTLENCETLFGYTPKQCADYLTLAGDTSDNIKGYPGMGEVRSLQFIKDHVSIKIYLKKRKPHGIQLDLKKLQEVVDTSGILVNLKMFYLRFLKGRKKVTFINERKSFNKKGYKSLCMRYGLRTHQAKTFIKTFQL